MNNSEDDGVARASDAVSIFEDRQTQQALLTDLAEVTIPPPPLSLLIFNWSARKTARVILMHPMV